MTKPCNSIPPCMFLLEYRSGCSMKDITLRSLSGCEKHRVYDPTNYKDLERESQGTRHSSLDDVKKEQIRKLIVQGLTVTEILDMLPTVTRYAVETLAKKDRLVVTNARKLIDVVRVTELVESGHSIAEIIETTGHTDKGIRQLLKRLNITPIKKYRASGIRSNK